MRVLAWGKNSPEPIAPCRYGVPALDPTQTQTLLGFRVRQANPRVYSSPCAQRREDKIRRRAGGQSRAARGARSAGERELGAAAARAAGASERASEAKAKSVFESKRRVAGAASERRFSPLPPRGLAARRRRMSMEKSCHGFVSLRCYLAIYIAGMKRCGLPLPAIK